MRIRSRVKGRRPRKFTMICSHCNHMFGYSDKDIRSCVSVFDENYRIFYVNCPYCRTRIYYK